MLAVDTNLIANHLIGATPPRLKQSIARGEESFALADARAMDGRVKPGHDGN
jgi:hypothetical protein